MSLSQHNDPVRPIRPGYGTKGRVLKVATNYFELTMIPDTMIYQYDVEVKQIDAKDPEKLKDSVIAQVPRTQA